MQNLKVFFAVAILFSALFFNGCLQSTFDSGMAKISEMQARYNLGEQFAPNNLEQIASFKAELNKLKQETKDSALSSFIDLRLNAVDTMESLIMSDLEFRRTNTANVDCRRESPLNKGIGFLENALNKSALGIKRFEAFKTSYPDLVAKIQQNGFQEERFSELNSSIKTQLDSAKELKLVSCP
ncbi:MAG TPA: hypothetical protein VI977_05930 [archaeon]|nr:hypothetical protein [archaeon]